jgi:hypothetical protein
MKEKLNQFIIDTQGQFVEVSDKTNIYQCKDLAYLWVLCLGFPKATIQGLYAYTAYTQPTDTTRQYFDLIPNDATFIPQDGDITVFDKTSSNPAGHIGIALGGGTVTSFRNFEQNYPTGTNCAVRIRNYNTPKLLGVLRPKITPPVQLVITDQTKIPQLGGMEVQAVRSKLTDQETLLQTLTTRLQQIHSISG